MKQMELPLTGACHEAISDDDRLVHEWRVTQLTGLGILSALLLLDAGHRLQETGVAPDDLGVRRRTLDEVFLSLIGNPAQDRAGPPETEAAQ